MFKMLHKIHIERTFKFEKFLNLSKLKNEIFDKSSVTQVAHQGNTQVCHLATLLFVQKKSTSSELNESLYH